MKSLKILALSAIFALAIASVAEAGGVPTKIMPFEKGCTSEDISVTNSSTMSWTASGIANRSIMFQVMEDVDVYIGYDENISSSTKGFVLSNQYDTYVVTLSENTEIWFWGDGSTARVTANYCR